ncbi:MAG: hypothetical protein JSS91_03040 [Bacteroidetes bacterium]|nr:hypothetical protein [Bacteroidota bacterium]
MKKIFIVICFLISAGYSFSQDTHWSSFSYYYSNGPVSPEYQYNYRIIMNEFGEGVYVYTNSKGTKQYDFSISGKKLKKFNRTFKKSFIFSAGAEEMKSEKNLMGGPEKELEVTMWQSPDLDAKPRTINIPSHLNEKYSEEMDCIIKQIENLVPKSIKDKAKDQK